MKQKSLLNLPLFSTLFAMLIALATTSGPTATANDLVSAQLVAKELGYDFKVVTPAKLATFCRPDGTVCIPVRLSATKHKQQGADLLIAKTTLEQALQCRIAIEENKLVAVSAVDAPTTDQNGREQQNTGITATWGKDRGFSRGQTVPDIPLVDLQGNEVRFSAFLGKRYILYCWASW